MVMLLASPVLAQAPAAPQATEAHPHRWQAFTGACYMSLRERDPDWRLRIDLLRVRTGHIVFLVRIRDPAFELPEADARIRLGWGSIAFGERGWTVPVHRALPPSERRSLTIDVRPAAGPGLDAMIAQARRSTQLKVTLPNLAEPYQLVSLGFSEAWAALDVCAPAS